MLNIQTIGRARTTKEESAIVVVFSNWPLAGVQRENLPSTLNADYTELITIRDDYPALFGTKISQEVAKPKQVFELSLADLRSFDHLKNPNHGFKTIRTLFIKEKTPEGVANTA